jgi:secreted trypsin-like serine protease
VGGGNASNLTNADNPGGTNAAGGSIEGDTAPGDSGGPLFQFDSVSSAFVITGVHSFGSDNALARYGDIGVDTYVTPYANFISYYQNNVPEPTSVGVVIGAAGLLATRRRKRIAKPVI